MPKIKIVSNPYKKETRYQKQSSDESRWVDIDYANNPNSKLLSGDLTGGFFPFKAKKIVDLLAEEYRTADEVLEILFEGSADEFEELKAICEEEAYTLPVKAYKSGVYLENARDILPDVRSLFQEMSALISRSVSRDKIRRDLNRYIEASNDVVPICVLGNYSAGKSTFINALIGSEILPSGTEPITAKVYKISRSPHLDRASIKYKYLGYDVALQFSERETIFAPGTIENDLSAALKSALNAAEGESIPVRVNRALTIINAFESETEHPLISDLISDLIEVEIPFAHGVLVETQHPFVIFDTPGSNSASNARHLAVLKDAMANMTNGLPVFLCTPDSLDSTDNEDLYHIIRDLEELDNRFTMIVVNKADSTGVQRGDSTAADRMKTLAQAVPKNLYSSGLFYVSSILGLGAKTNGSFADENYADIYEAQVERYRNPDHRFYRTLYRLNIQPDQMKKKSDALAAAQTDPVYANSGLFTVETEIEAFAGKYSAYNKCYQSKQFLTNVIDTTQKEIENKKRRKTDERKAIENTLEAEKRKLLDSMQAESEKRMDGYKESYKDHIARHIEDAENTFSADAFKEWEAVFIKEQEDALDVGGLKEKAKKAKESLADNLRSNVRNALKERKAAALKDALDSWEADAQFAKEAGQDRKEAGKLAVRQASESLMEYAKKTYVDTLQDIYTRLDAGSREYWTGNTEELRNALARIVAGSEALTEAKREELERIIINYSQLTFRDDSTETIFEKDRFEIKFRIFHQTIWESDHLNIEKLARTYNEHIVDGAKDRYESVEASHCASADEWVGNLLDEISENIVEYSPELSKHKETIEDLKKEISELEESQRQLKLYTQQLSQMMDWKTAEQ